MTYKIMPYDKSELGDELLVVATNDGIADISKACYLNRTAADIWRIFENNPNSCSLDFIINMIETKYKINHEIAVIDCTTVLDSLISAGLIVQNEIIEK